MKINEKVQNYLNIVINSQYSAEADPREPALKLSTKRTVLCSKGEIVPPLVMSTIR